MNIDLIVGFSHRSTSNASLEVVVQWVRTEVMGEKSYGEHTLLTSSRYWTSMDVVWLELPQGLRLQPATELDQQQSKKRRNPAQQLAGIGTISVAAYIATYTPVLD